MSRMSRTNLCPQHLTERSDEVRCGVDVLPNRDTVDRLPDTVPKGSLELFLFLRISMQWRHHRYGCRTILV